MADEREFDLALLGATGFTGRLTAAHLASRLQGSGTRWVIAGRDRARLDRLAAELDGAPDVAVASTGDPEGLLRLARRTRVLGTTVGPYAVHGVAVARACVLAGTHYADVTGETAFVDELRWRFDRDAQQAGIKAISACGFEAVPTDLGVRHLVGLLPDDVPLDVRGYVWVSGRPSGGTVASALGALTAGGRPSPPADRPPSVREVGALPARIHRVPRLDAYAMPLPTIDTAVVLRSAAVLDGYGTSFHYGNYVPVGRRATAVAGLAAAGAAAALASAPATRRLLRWALPHPGEGPDEDARARNGFELILVGHGGGTEVVSRVRGGDPYAETGRMLAEALLALAAGEGPALAGMLTPAAGLGAPYHHRLSDLGIAFELIERHGGGPGTSTSGGNL